MYTESLHAMFWSSCSVKSTIAKPATFSSSLGNKTAFVKDADCSEVRDMSVLCHVAILWEGDLLTDNTTLDNISMQAWCYGPKNILSLRFSIHSATFRPR